MACSSHRYKAAYTSSFAFLPKTVKLKVDTGAPERLWPQTNMTRVW